MSKKISLVKNFFFAEQRVTQQEFTINFICYLKHPVPWLYLFSSCKYAKNRVKLILGAMGYFSSHLGAEEFRTSSQ